METGLDPDGILERLQLARLALQRDRLAQAIGGTPEAACLTASYEQLGAVHQARLLLSADLGEWLALWEKERNEGVHSTSLAQLEELLDSERIAASALGGMPCPLDEAKGRIWSPMGDYSFLHQGGSVEVIPAPRIGDVIAIDFDSPLARSMDYASGVLSQPPLPLDETEKTRAVEVLQAGLELIDASMPYYGRLIREFTRRIIVRKSLESVSDAVPGASIFASEHMTRQIGAIRMLNPHLPEFSAAMAAEKILHESIHNYLAACEYVHGSFCHRGNEVRPVSPWSGNPIPNSSFIHAVFVYFACFKLMEAAGEAGLLSAPEHDQARIRARTLQFVSGFLSNQSMTDFLITAEGVDAVLLERLDAMQEAIRARVRVEEEDVEYA
ncbi:hypothetical protein ASG87_06140 [Frateuria sp. Soil773]|nr:hypothetical protein ASG87_06140 [Frateuria sp. Soil773]